MTDADPARPKPRSIRFQVLATVNAILGLSALVFLALDYQRELTERVEDRRLSLTEEARHLALTVKSICGADERRLQRHIDSVCGQVNDQESPGHHIVAVMSETAYQATSHHRASPEMLEAIRRAAASGSGTAVVGHESVIVGTHEDGELTIYVSEYLSDLTHSVRSRFLWRVIAVVCLGAMAAALVSLILLRIVARPLENLVSTVNGVAKGDFGQTALAPQSAEMATLATAINFMSGELRESEHRRLQELGRARQIQQHLVPRAIEIPSLVVASAYEPADEVSGDYFDAVPLGDDEWLLCIADVTGHGIPAALGAAMLKALLLDAAERYDAPGDILKFIDERFTRVSLPAVFATMALLRWGKDSEVIYASGGHEPMLHIRQGEPPREHAPTGSLLGVGLGSAWDSQVIPVDAGDRLVLYTDGLTETFDRDRRMFGVERLTSAFQSSAHILVDDAVAGVLGDVRKFRGEGPQLDDVTVVALEIQ